MLDEAVLVCSTGEGDALPRYFRGSNRGAAYMSILGEEGESEVCGKRLWSVAGVVLGEHEHVILARVRRDDRAVVAREVRLGGATLKLDAHGELDKVMDTVRVATDLRHADTILAVKVGAENGHGEVGVACRQKKPRLS